MCWHHRLGCWGVSRWGGLIWCVSITAWGGVTCWGEWWPFWWLLDVLRWLLVVVTAILRACPISYNRVFHSSHFSHHFWIIFDLIFIFYCQIIENGHKMATMNDPNIQRYKQLQAEQCQWVLLCTCTLLTLLSIGSPSEYWTHEGTKLSEDTTVHLPLLPPPPTVPDTSLHTNDWTSANCQRPDRSPTYVSDLRVQPTCQAYVSILRVQLSDHIINLIIYLR